jgi:hypothetical protein
VIKERTSTTALNLSNKVTIARYNAGGSTALCGACYLTNVFEYEWRQIWFPMVSAPTGGRLWLGIIYKLGRKGEKRSVRANAPATRANTCHS